MSAAADAPRDQRTAAYAASPTFAQLRPLLEGYVGKFWAGPGCRQVHVCDDFVAGWVPWALQQSVFTVLRAPDAATVQAFYGPSTALRAAPRRGRAPVQPQILARRVQA